MVEETPRDHARHPHGHRRFRGHRRHGGERRDRSPLPYGSRVGRRRRRDRYRLLFGAAMTPYEVFFFSSGAVEEQWSERDLAVNRANVYIGFPLGGLLSLAIMAAATIVFVPRHITVDTLPQVPLPVVFSLGKIGLACALVGIFAATF